MNIVLCADGTCNAFGYSSSNVARLLEYVDLDDCQTQIAVYDQGIGTQRREHTRVVAFRDTLSTPSALHLLDPPSSSWGRPWTWPYLLGSMALGWGLETNVRQLYVKLGELYRPDDRIYLFGFSRGAFTVRVLAALLWRYGLPPSRHPGQIGGVFEAAWHLFDREYPDEDGMASARALEFRKSHHCPTIHFLGLWDTVKSYGGIVPVMLPHLRHNPKVERVRHALSLDERRGWFEATTWGWLDSDRCDTAAKGRIDPADRDVIAGRDVKEVWFSGCHADVGGGGIDDRTPGISLRWMLAEAEAAGLRLNDVGAWALTYPARGETPQINDSRTPGWQIVEQALPRWGINNGGRWPAHYRARRGASPRNPLQHSRDGVVWFHDSVLNLSDFQRRSSGKVSIETVSTSRPAVGSIVANHSPL